MNTFRHKFFIVAVLAVFSFSCLGGLLPAQATATPIETPTPSETPEPICTGPNGFVELPPGMEAVFSWESEPLAKVGWDGVNITLSTAEGKEIYPIGESGMLSLELIVYEAGSPIGQADVDFYVCIGGSIYLDPRFFVEEYDLGA